MTYAKLIVKKNHDDRNQSEVRFLIDSGVVYSLIPKANLEKLGIQPYRRMKFVLTDGAEIERRVGNAYFEWRGEGGAASVIFGEEGDEPVLDRTDG